MSANRRTRLRGARGLVAAAAGLGLVATPLALTTGAVADDSTTTAAKSAVDYSSLQLLALNDFHGQIEKVDPGTDPARTSNGEVRVDGVDVPAGGAEYLATHLKQWRAEARARGAKSITVAAGDLIGATPLLSAAFHDEPTIETMNLVGLDISSVGNHEFDEGWRELRRMQNGGCIDDGDGAKNQNSCPDAAHPFEGADFDYLAANVKKESTGKTILPPYSVRKVDGHKVAFIGMTLQDTPNIVTKEGVEGLKFTDEVKTVDRLVPILREQGIRAMVVLLHEGAVPASITDVDGCDTVVGPGIDIAKALHPEIDAVISGHTHLPYNCTVRDSMGRKRLVSSAYSVGRVVTEVNFKIGPHGQIKRGMTTATNHVVTNADGTAASTAVTDLIARYKALVAPIENKVLGKLAPAETQNSLVKPSSTTYDGEDYELGNLIADSQKLDTSTTPDGGTQAVVAMMNPGGIRTSLNENAAGDVTYGAAFAVQPFNNYVVSQTLTGQQILDVLNEQWNGRNESTTPTDPTKIGTYKVLQVSGLKYTWSKTQAAAAGNAIVGDVLIDANGDGNVSETLDPAASYRVVVNSFLAGGGDGFPTLAQGTGVYFGGLDIDSLAAHLAGHNPYVPPATDRITAAP